MHRFSNGQIAVGMNLKASNHWVKKARTILWIDIEKIYAKLFTNRKGNVAKPLRLALGACIIQAEYGYTDEETALQIQENPYTIFSFLLCVYVISRFPKARLTPGRHHFKTISFIVLKK